MQNVVEKIVRPTIVISPKQVTQNILKISAKASQNKSQLRPHFKTHQSPEVGTLFRKQGISAITVSSVSMAKQFAEVGWQDILIAFPTNIREIADINALARNIKLHLIADSKETVAFLNSHLQHPVSLWLEIDVGHNRSGIFWQHEFEVCEIAKQVKSAKMLRLEGLLAHAGHSYKTRKTEEARQLFLETVNMLLHLKDFLASEGIENLKISYGDTPVVSQLAILAGIDELRVGNFTFYDWQQVEIGSCKPEEIALTVACPIVSVRKHRNEVILYGGAVHLSKDAAKTRSGETIYGRVGRFTDSGWTSPIDDAALVSLSQEHGILRVPSHIIDQFNIGDLLAVYPVHCCLAMDLLKQNVVFLQ